MDDRVTQFRVGVLVVATCFIAGLLIMLFGEMPSFISHQYTIYVRFPQAPGVTIDTPVLKSGILIGRVTRVTLLDNDDGAVVVSLKIDSDRKLRSSETCKIKSGSILGDAVLEFIPSKQARGPNAQLYRDGDYLDGIVAEDPLSVMETATSALQTLVNLENDVRQALDSIQTAGQQVGGMAEGLNAVVANNADQFQRILTKSEQAMDRFDFALTAIDGFIRDDNLKQKLEEAISQVPDLMTDASDVMAALKESIGSINETFDSIGDVVGNVNESFDSFKDIGGRIDEIGDSIYEVMARANKNLENLEGLTEPLGRSGESLTASLEQTLKKVDTVMTNAASFTDALNDRKGTLGMLMYDRELYDRINDAAANIEKVTERAIPLIDRARPIVDDVRVFTDKVARDPGRLGVKGVLDRRKSGTKR